MSSKTEAAQIQQEIRLAKLFATEIKVWSEGGWQAVLEGFVREMRGIHPDALVDLGFNSSQLSVSDGKPQWGILAMSDVAKKINTDSSVLLNRRFCRAALSGFAAFFRFADRQTDNEHEELVNWSNQITTTLYGDNARLADRRRGRSAPRPDSASTASRQRRLKKRLKSDRDKEIRDAMRGKQGQKPQRGGR